MPRRLFCPLGAAFLTLTACHSAAPANRGYSGPRMDPAREAPSEAGLGKLTSADLVAATDDMARSIASRLDITDRSSPPHIVVGDIENRTTVPHQNYDVFLARLRTQLQSSGAREGLTFLGRRDEIDRQRRREYADAAGAPFETSADYVLTCVVYDFPSGGTNYVLLDYQLVQLRAAESGPDVGPGAIVWEHKYEVKFR